MDILKTLPRYQKLIVSSLTISIRLLGTSKIRTVEKLHSLIFPATDVLGSGSSMDKRGGPGAVRHGCHRASRGLRGIDCRGVEHHPTHVAEGQRRGRKCDAHSTFYELCYEPHKFTDILTALVLLFPTTYVNRAKRNTTCFVPSRILNIDHLSFTLH